MQVSSNSPGPTNSPFPLDTPSRTELAEQVAQMYFPPTKALKQPAVSRRASEQLPPPSVVPPSVVTNGIGQNHAASKGANLGAKKITRGASYNATSFVSLSEEIAHARNPTTFGAIWERHQEAFTPGQLIELLYKASSYNHVPREVLDVLDAVKTRISSFSADELADLSSATVQLQNCAGFLVVEKGDALLASIKDELVADKLKKLQSCSNQNLVQLAKSFSSVKTAFSTDMLQAIMHDTARLSKLNGSQLISLASCVNRYNPTLYNAIDKLVKNELFQNQKIASCTVEDLADLSRIYMNHERNTWIVSQINSMLLANDLKLFKMCQGRELAVFANALKRADSPDRERFYQAAQEAFVNQRQLEDCTGDELCLVVQGYDAVNLLTDTFAGSIRSELTVDLTRNYKRYQKLYDCKGPELRTLVCSFGKLPSKQREFFKRLEFELCSYDKIQSCTGHDLAQIASVYQDHHLLSDKLANAISARLLKGGALDQCDGNDMADLLFAFRVITPLHMELYNACESRLLKGELEKCSAKSLATLAASYSKLPKRPEKLMRQIEGRLIGYKAEISNCSSKELVMCANAFKGEPSSKILNEVRRQLVSFNKIDACTLEELSILANIFKKDESIDLHRRIREKVLENNANALNTADMFTLSRLVDGFSHTSAATREFCDAIEKQFLQLRSEGACKLEDLTQCIHGFARAGFGSSHLFDILETEIMRSLSQLPEDTLTSYTRNIFMCAWSLACKGRSRSPVFVVLSNLVSKLMSEKANFQEAELTQLAQIALALRLENRENYEKLVSVEVRERIKGHKDAMKHRPPESSQMHKEIATAIKGCNQTIELENETSLDGLIVDIWLPAKRRAVEVNGPTHYVEDGKELNGVSQFKMRLIEKVTGSPGVVVSGTDWMSAKMQNYKKFINDKILTKVA